MEKLRVMYNIKRAEASLDYRMAFTDRLRERGNLVFKEGDEASPKEIISPSAFGESQEAFSASKSSPIHTARRIQRAQSKQDQVFAKTLVTYKQPLKLVPIKPKSAIEEQKSVRRYKRLRRRKSVKNPKVARRFINKLKRTHSGVFT